MSETIVHVETEDGFVLAGCRFDPPGGRARTVVVWLHGLNLGFTEPEYVQIGRLSAHLGLCFLRPKRGGAALAPGCAVRPARGWPG
ncbi:MAG: hypothetical protein HC794_02335, partial [Nitrospiraceae bacterium]|nr:hypothetical protein [Nitrospiraceae bacterium]